MPPKNKKKKKTRGAGSATTGATAMVEDVSKKMNEDVEKEKAKERKKAAAKAPNTSFIDEVEKEAVKEIVAEMRQGTHDKAALKAAEEINKISDPDNVARLVVLLCICAISIDAGTAYQRAIPSEALIPSIWDGKNKAVYIAGAIGCAIMSTDMAELPPTLRPLKIIWTSMNGGYASIFTYRRLEGEASLGNLPQTMAIAIDCIQDGTREALARVISAKCKPMSFGKYGYWYLVVTKYVDFFRKFIAVLIPQSVSGLIFGIYAVFMEWLNTIIVCFIALLLVFCMIFKKSEEALAYKMLTIAFWLFDGFFVYFFGYRAIYVTFFIVVVFFKSVGHPLIKAYLAADDAEAKEYAERFSELFESLRQRKAPTVEAMTNVMEASLEVRAEDLTTLEGESPATAPTVPAARTRSTQGTTRVAAAVSSNLVNRGRRFGGPPPTTADAFTA